MKILKTGIISVLALIALISIGRIITKAYADNRFDGAIWGVDLYQFWYSGQFFWQGKDPYTAMLNGDEPASSVSFGVKQSFADEQALHRKWPIQYIPSSAPLYLVLLPLSLLPWTLASVIWGAVNLVLGVIYTWIFARLNHASINQFKSLVILCISFCLLATRQLFELGQVSLLVYVFMFAALLIGEKHPISAGILLGIAFSKYSIAFPLLLYFVYRRNYRLVVVTLLVQLIGLLLLAGFTQSNFIQMMASTLTMSWRIMTTQQTAGYASHIFSVGWGDYAIIIAGLCTLGVLVTVGLWHWRSSSSLHVNELAGMVLVCIASVWSLVMIYHARHDWLVVMLPISLIAYRLSSIEPKQIAMIVLSKRQTWIIYGITATSILVWCLPLYALLGTDLYDSLLVITTIVLLGISIAFLYAIRRPLPEQVPQIANQ